MQQSHRQGRIERRRLGRADEHVSALGIGGFHLSKPEDPEVAVQIVRSAIERGADFLDNSWDYADGESERRMGRALADGYRDRAFLMTKVDSHSREGLLRQVEQSLERLRTDHVDLLQLHEVIRPGDPDEAFAPGGAMDALLQLRDEGVITYIGFTGHKDPAIHEAMIRRGLREGFVFDVVQMPINIFDASFCSFRQRVVPLCLEHGIAVLGMKPLGAWRLVGATGLTAPDLLRWALSQPVAVAITGCQTMRDLDQALDVARGFEPLSEDEQRRMVDKARPEALDGSLEKYKTTLVHDGTTEHPEWLE